MSYYNDKRYNSGGYNSSYNGGSNRPQTKRSAARRGQSNSGRPYVSGYNKRRGNYLAFIAFPYKDTQEVKSQNGKTWQNWVIRYSVNRGPEALDTCLYEVASGRIIWKSKGMVINPNKNYAGTWKRRENG